MPNRYPVPHIRDFAIWLRGSRIFSKIDSLLPDPGNGRLRSAYTSLSGCHLVFPAQSFQRLIDQVLRGLPYVYTYTDDILIASKNIEEQNATCIKSFGDYLNLD